MPVFGFCRWSADERYLALIEKKMLSIFAEESLSSPSLTSIRNVIDFSRSPIDPSIALLHYDDSTGDVLVYFCISALIFFHLFFFKVMLCLVIYILVLFFSILCVVEYYKNP